ncbi:hypothetical protein G7Z17_g13598 [Cylindrodendrum hubeiense]|uniref:Uncharacterized protein n=1 Tax=Cylindrodendrum hubeiense TaxID=595255 RepID=A0A9P5L251_9HYPO|nr:hypothetical protein G7Z17_g13598 [Cylindrodendrum hubeiense]
MATSAPNLDWGSTPTTPLGNTTTFCGATYRIDEPVNMRMQSSSYTPGTLLFSRDSSIQKAIAAIEGLNLQNSASQGNQSVNLLTGVGAQFSAN